MAQRPRTPTEIAKGREKKTYSFSLKIDRVEKLKKLAADAGIPDSELVDEAIESYLNTVSNGSKPKD